MRAKKLLTFATIIFLFSCLFGCATTYYRGKGTIIAEKKLQAKDYKLHDSAKIGAVIGGGIGATGGGLVGGAIGLGLGALSDVTGSMLIATTFGGAVIGAAIIGGVGVITGGGLGYAIDLTRPDIGLYQFVVKLEDSPKTLTIIQYRTPLPVHSEVRVLEKNNITYIKE